jgi:glucose-specific phosphotransferase system IIA component
MNWMGNLQHFGRALMLPMIALPAAALFLSLANIPWHLLGFTSLDEVLRLAGYTIFSYLPIIFAVGVALGLTENAGMAGMSSLLAYFLCTQIARHFLDDSFQINVAGGILIGLAAAWSFHKFKAIELPEYIQFFGGSRFVPLFMSFASLVFSFLFVQIGPWISRGMLALSELLQQMGGFGAFLYGMTHRLLVPSGLHHILNNVFWFQIGSYELPDGRMVHGDLPRFFAGDGSAGIYMAGLYPTMMFALPAIALAIIHEAREDLQPKVKVTFMTAALACFFTGVTEPIEFAFLFVAPMLFVIHAILSGLSMFIVYLLDIRHGFSFSAGAIDYFVNLHLSRNGWLLIPIGLIYGIVYYMMFRWAIRKFHLATPGREDGSALDEGAGDIPYRAPLILQAIGDKHNVIKMEACITRLRLTLRNDRRMDIAALRHLGAAGVIRLGGGHVQIVFGTFSELIREEIMKLLRKDIRTISFHAPMQGLMMPLQDVPDPIFSGKMVGDGVAFFPDRGEVVAPVSGTVVHVHTSKHAIGIRTDEGLEVLLHVGIDTSHLQGKWFDCKVTEGERVEPGQLLLKFNIKKVKQHCKSLVTPMLVTNPDQVKAWSYAPFKQVKLGQASVMSIVLKEVKANGKTTNS